MQGGPGVVILVRHAPSLHHGAATHRSDPLRSARRRGTFRDMGSVRARPLVVAVMLTAGAILASACSDGGGVTSGAGGAATTTTAHPSAPRCRARPPAPWSRPPASPSRTSTHIAVCTPLTYATNPPSGGDHWPIWAAFKKYTSVVPREMYVHDLEHGAGATGCSSTADRLDVVLLRPRNPFDGMADPLCLSTPARRRPPSSSPPTPTATPIAAPAPGPRYTATCIDLPSLRGFANANYGKGREVLCTDGVDVEASPPCAPVDGGTGGLEHLPRAPHPQPRAGG